MTRAQYAWGPLFFGAVVTTDGVTQVAVLRPSMALAIRNPDINQVILDYGFSGATNTSRYARHRAADHSE